MIYIYIHKIEASLFHQCNIFPRVCISLLYLNNANSAERSRWTVIPCNFVQLHEPKAQYLSGHIEIAFCQLFFLLLSLNRIPFDKKHRDVTRKGKRKSIVGKKIEREKRKKKNKNDGPRKSSGINVTRHAWYISFPIFAIGIFKDFWAYISTRYKKKTERKLNLLM